MPLFRRRNNPTPDPIERIHQLCEQPEKWHSVSTDDLKLMIVALFGGIYYGDRVSSGDDVSRMSALYTVAKERLTRDERIEVLMAIYHSVERGQTGFSALLPFIHAETDSSVISTAALHIASVHPIFDDDPLAGPKFVLRVAESVGPGQKRVDILSGLLMLGDRRMMPLLVRAWRLLNDDEREELCFAHSGFVSAVLVEFLLTRLEKIDDEENPDVFGAVAGALARLPFDAEEPVIRDIERKLPVNAPDDRPGIRVVREWTMKEYGRKIAPRLYAVMAREQEPKAVPTILEAWGLPIENVSSAALAARSAQKPAADRGGSEAALRQAVLDSYVSLRKLLTASLSASTATEFRDITVNLVATERNLATWKTVQGMEALDAARSALRATREVIQSAIAVLSGKPTNADLGAVMINAWHQVLAMRAPLAAAGVTLPPMDGYEEMVAGGGAMEAYQERVAYGDADTHGEPAIRITREQRDGSVEAIAPEVLTSAIEQLRAHGLLSEKSQAAIALVDAIVFRHGEGNHLLISIEAGGAHIRAHNFGAQGGDYWIAWYDNRFGDTNELDRMAGPGSPMWLELQPLLSALCKAIMGEDTEEDEGTEMIEITLTPRSAGIPSGGNRATNTDEHGHSIGGMSLEDIAAEREKGWWLDLQDEYLDGSPMDETEGSVARREQMVRDAMADVEESAEARGLTIQFEHAITGLLFSVKSIYVMPSNEEYDRITRFAKELAAAFEFNQYTVHRLVP